MHAKIVDRIREGRSILTWTNQEANAEHHQYVKYKNEAYAAKIDADLMKGYITARDTMASSSSSRTPAPKRPWHDSDGEAEQARVFLEDVPLLSKTV